MKQRLIISIITAAVFLTSLSNRVCAAAPRQMPSVSAKYAAVVEMNTGELICEKNGSEKTSMASTTKIMTALLLCEMCDLDEEIVATKEMVTVEGSSMGLQEGDRVHYRDLLYGLLLASGNDAANTTAISIAGSIENFADLMNKKAAEIGMTDTNFVTPSGLDDEKHYSTAIDMAKLAVYAMKNEQFATACSSKTMTLEYGNPPYRRTLKNHNKLLWYYDGAIGIKTGFTKKSGRCLVSCAQKDGMGVIAVTLNAPSDWSDHATLLDYGFSQLKVDTLYTPDDIGNVAIANSEGKVAVNFTPPTVTLLPEQFDKVTFKTTLDRFVFAPVKKGQKLGKVEYFIGDKKIAEAEICAAYEIKSGKYTVVNKDYKYWLKALFGAK
ncbi:MAG: D-alanyl-D-alanine carboxypeptidase [Clostridia bacterium]|nr:D-alanyl-D-alanine carboxypeptidase [Clostridia bacterium]MBQ9957953.1 D-alanyl-D-alanine carboxypeptidase [Clostridia bacterium]